MRKLILSSSQSKRPIGTDPWVQATIKAVDESVQQGHEIVASLGLTSWELALWRAATTGADVHLVCPIAPGVERDALREELLASFAMRENRVVWHWVSVRAPGRKSAWPLRDQVAVQLADKVLEVSVRPSGRLARLLQNFESKRTTTYAVPCKQRRRGAQWELRAPAPAADLWPDGAVVHLTRASDGPWPDEPRWRFYEDVVSSTETYARSGFQTLCRIVREQRIRGSYFRARGGQRRVSLTACRPEEVLALIRFRARYARYGFEPYAVVLSARAAVQLGAGPVSYDGDEVPEPFLQGPGKDGHWRREKEWRVPGDVDLSGLDPREVKIVAATGTEARELAAWCPYPVGSFGYTERPASEKIVRIWAPEPTSAAS